MLISIAISLVISSIVFILLSYVILNKHNEISRLKSENENLEEEINFIRKDNQRLSYYVRKYQEECNNLKKELVVNKNIKHKSIDNNLMKKAVRIAMINSHPDKGGNTNDFIKFKELYDSYK